MTATSSSGTMDDSSARRHSLRKSQLIDFPNVAAGHDGVLSNQSGDLIVKPCKDEEVRFYQQTWDPDPDPSSFAYFMPKFFGTLSLQEHPPASDSLPTAAIATAAAATAAAAAAAAGATASSSSIAASSPTLSSPTAATASPAERRPSHVSSLSAPGTPKSTASRGPHGRSPSRTSIISHLPVDESLAPTRPPKAWEPTHGAKIDADTAVVMENIAAGLVKPNILDVKIGSRLWADDAHPAKRQKLDKVAGETTSGSLGFRIAGMKVWAGDGVYEHANREEMDSRDTSSSSNKADRPSDQGEVVKAKSEKQKDARGVPMPSIRQDDYASYDRDYGRAFTAANVKSGFEDYFIRPQTGIRKKYSHEVISRFVEDLRGLLAAMVGMEVRMYSASLLFVYEGDGAALREDFRRENRMFEEARLRAEANEAGMEGVVPSEQQTPALDNTVTNNLDLANLPDATMIVEGGPQVTLTDAGASDEHNAAGAPTLPQIQAGGPGLEMPAQLVLSDEQFAAASAAGSAAAAGSSRSNNDNMTNENDDHDHDDDDDEDDDDVEDDAMETLLPKIQAMKVIDFAHASWAPGQGPDENFLNGVRSVVKILEEMLEDLSDE